MATPEEQKSKLQVARRAQTNKQRAPRLDWTGENTKNTPMDPAIRQANATDFNSLHASRASALASNRFQQGLSSTPPLIRSQFDEQQVRGISRTIDDDTARRLGMSQEQNEKQQQAQRLAGIQTAVNAQAQRQQSQTQQTQQVDEETRKKREEIKNVAKATMRRGAIYVTDLLASAFDLGSSGISFIVDIFIYLFTLGWLNLEMIYGKYFAKGKSRYIDPISWDPIPMAIDKEALLLQGFVVAADLALGVAILVFSFGGFCLIHDFVKVTGSITEAAQIGAALAQGESGGLCFGGIITSAFGL